MADIPESTKMDAVDILKTYADFIRNDVRADDLERHPYLPHIEQTIEDLRAAPPAMDREAVERVREAAYRQALEDVCNPLGYLQRMADAEGAKLSGMAYAIASDIGTIQRIAKEALSTLSADAIRQGEGWQSIETAPRDGTWFIADGGGLDRPTPMKWCERVGAWEADAVMLDDWDQQAEGYSRPLFWLAIPDRLATPASHASDGGEA